MLENKRYILNRQDIQKSAKLNKIMEQFNFNCPNYLDFLKSNFSIVNLISPSFPYIPLFKFNRSFQTITLHRGTALRRNNNIVKIRGKKLTSLLIRNSNIDNNAGNSLGISFHSCTTLKKELHYSV